MPFGNRLVRMHSECLTGDALAHCAATVGLSGAALRQIEAEGEVWSSTCVRKDEASA